MKKIFGKILYGLVFIIVMPILLMLWSYAASKNINLSVIRSSWIGYAIALVGLFIMTTGMINLWTKGQGLPMNAYPPLKFVSTGIYKYIPHPIYVGACFIVAGVSIIFQSTAGFWLITPVFILGCTALVVGFENDHIKQTFTGIFHRTLINVPENSLAKASAWDIISVYILVLIPWLLLYEMVVFIGTPTHPVSTILSFEQTFPVIEWTEIFYASIYVLITLLPLFLKTKSEVRNFMLNGLTATALGIFCFICFPFVSEPRMFEAQTFLGKLLLFDRSYDTAGAALPAFHATWALLVAYSFSKHFTKITFVWYFIAIAICIACITTGMHSILDVIAGVALFFVAIKRNEIWSFFRNLFEQIANSWTEWRFGKIRIINHGFYGGIGALAGILIAGFIAGGNQGYAILTVGLSVIVCAGLWAQFIEGSPRLLRPFGYYGGLIGAIIGAVLAYFLFRTDIFILLAAFGIAGPWIQIMGRLRCLVQGCCHGRHSAPGIGIRFNHEKSRVLRIAGLKNEFLHPTQVYSIISNIFIGIFLWKLWMVNQPASFIAGMYLILAGLSRFVEEHFRGEPQTPYFAGLRVYQWTALIGVVVGAIFTSLPKMQIFPLPAFSFETVAVALILGLLANFALGIDFPDSNKRFSRLV